MRTALRPIKPDYVRELSDRERLYRTLVEEGFVHHASMSHGDQVAVLKLACKFLDIVPVVVD